MNRHSFVGKGAEKCDNYRPMLGYRMGCTLNGYALSLFRRCQMNNLDTIFLASLTPERIKTEFNDLKTAKTDILSNEIKIARGCDGVNHEDFQNNIDEHARTICEKGASMKYRFAPFRETKVPKPPYHTLKEAMTAGASINKPDKFIRTLSISTIQDTIFQKLLSDVAMPHAEIVFARDIDLHSFGYRKAKSSKMCVKKIRRLIDEGYLYVLDADISKFFDEIEHGLLTEKMIDFFGIENEFIQKFLYRFIHVDRLPPEMLKDYKFPERAEKRVKGIPQGGVLSGLLANVFLYDFDIYVVKKLMPKFDFKYFRYADDFVLLFKSMDWIAEVHTLLEKRLCDEEKLTLHPIGEKSEILDLSENGKDTLDFLGFEISPRFLRVKEDNFKKFRKRIIATLQSIEIESQDAYLSKIVPAISRRIVGLEDNIEHNGGLCPHCKKLIKKRSWIGYFMMVNDVRQLRNIDTMIRTEIYADYYRRYKSHLRKKDLFHATNDYLTSVESMYYKYKKQFRKYEKYGYCDGKLYRDEKTGQIKIIHPENQNLENEIAQHQF